MSVATAGRRYNYKSSIYNFFDRLKRLYAAALFISRWPELKIKKDLIPKGTKSLIPWYHPNEEKTRFSPLFFLNAENAAY